MAEKIVDATVILRNDTLTNFETANKVYSAAEMLVVFDGTTVRTKIADGVSDFSSLPYREDVTEIPLATATDDGLLSKEGFLKLAVIDGAITEIASKAGENGTLTITKADGSTDDVPLTGLAHDILYDESNLVLTIPQIDSTTLVINLPKDNFVESGVYNTETKDIDLTLKDSTVVSIPAAALVDVYTSGSGTTDTVSITVSEDNKVSATIKVDTSSVLGVSDSGAITIDLSAYATTSELNSALTDKVDKNGTDRLMTAAEGSKLEGITEGANKVTASTTNGNILIDGTETTVYTLPSSVLVDTDTFIINGGYA